MIDAKEAKRMFRDIMKGCPRVKNADDLMAHCEFIAELTADTAEKIRAAIPEFKPDASELETASLLHDIGYCFTEENIYHPIVGGEFLTERGFPRLAMIIRGHTYAADVIRVTGYRNLDPKQYEPGLWQHVLIDYASLHCGKPGKRITPDEKFRRFRAKRGEKFQQIINMAEPRLRQEVADINMLMKGDKKTLLKYSFL